MTTNATSVLKEQVDRARRLASESTARNRFSGLHKEQASRAVYFVELAGAIKDLGLSNAFERSALSVEPIHPVPPSRLNREITKLKGAEHIGMNSNALGMSLVSLPMLKNFAPESEPVKMLKSSHFRAPLYLIDQLYGFTFFLQADGQFHNHCLAIDFWQSRLATMPPWLANELWKFRADAMLSGGASSGRMLFRNIIPPESDRFKMSQAAELVIRSESHLLDILAALKEGSSKDPNVQLWFRGQGNDHQVPNRAPLFPYRLTPYSNIPESSLIPSIYRSFDAHLESFDLYEQLLHELTEWVAAAKQIIPDNTLFSSRFTQQNPHALSVKGLTSFQRGLVLQQYGAPSAYLDITKDLMTAAWFATHACTQGKDGVLNFSSRAWKDHDASTWPTIFVFPLVQGVHPFLDLSSILPSDLALRPTRQSCGLVGGAGNLARNYCARYVGLKLRLHPDFRICNPVPAAHLFPSDEEDPAMLHLRTIGLASPGRRYPLTSVHQSSQ
ncbi:hypothetical protein [Achromobacter aegrifaciens]